MSLATHLPLMHIDNGASVLFTSPHPALDGEDVLSEPMLDEHIVEFKDDLCYIVATIHHPILPHALPVELKGIAV